MANEMQTESAWQTGPDAWQEFVRRHPELGLKPGKWRFHNFLRLHRQSLLDADAIRLAQRRSWIAHVERLCVVAFDCATGKSAPMGEVEQAHECMSTKVPRTQESQFPDQRRGRNGSIHSGGRSAS